MHGRRISLRDVKLSRRTVRVMHSEFARVVAAGAMEVIGERTGGAETSCGGDRRHNRLSGPLGLAGSSTMLLDGLGPQSAPHRKNSMGQSDNHNSLNIVAMYKFGKTSQNISCE